jgi:hypothetical protein
MVATAATSSTGCLAAGRGASFADGND